MRKELAILTLSYPFANGEGFLDDSLPFARDCFDRVVLQPLVGAGSPRSVPEGCFVAQPLFQSRAATLPFLLHPSRDVLRRHIRDFLRRARLHRLVDWATLFKSVAMCSALLRNRRFLDFVSTSRDNRVLWHFYWGSGFINVLPFLASPPRCVARMHRWDLFEDRQWHPLRPDVLARLRACFCISDKATKYLQDAHPNYASRIMLARMGCAPMPCSEFRPDTALRVLSVSSVIPLKRVNKILEAVSRCGHDVHWTHVGSGPGLSSIRRQTRRMRKTVFADLRGQLSRRDVLKMYAQQCFDIFVNLSAIEGVPVSIMEALSAGIPVLATDVGATAELVDETCGFLVSDTSSDLAGQAAAILSKIGKTDTRALRVAARARYEDRCQACINYDAFYRRLSSLADLDDDATTGTVTESARENDHDRQPL